MITVVKKDLLEMNVDVIAHQVNCQGVMGAGLALQISNTYPKVYAAYKKYCPNSELLGKIQVVDSGKHFVANLFAQDKYGRDKRYTDYTALGKCLTSLRVYMIAKGLKTLALPYGIGCGLAGGDWKIVCEIIRDVFTPVEDKITVYICKK